MCTINRSGRRPYGCPVPVGSGVCGETKTLDIINEFKRLYEEKMHEIDNSSCGDCLQEKIKLQQDWIGDLTEQNEMLVRAVEELEQEATERVKMLEEKLQRSAQCICEVMKRYREHDVSEDILEEPRKRIFNLESDLKNLFELMRRVRDDNELSLGGLTFYEIAQEELLGDKIEGKLSNGYVQSDSKKADQKNKGLDSTIQCLESKVGECERISRELKVKKEECEKLQKNMIDMRQALTEEVATKHDAILKLKRECQELEDRCIQADKQTAFRDDIIKELRKEIKQLKQQITQEEVEKLNKTIDELRNTLEESRRLQEVEEKEKVSEICDLNKKIKDLEKSLCDANDKMKEQSSKSNILNERIKELENCLCDANDKTKEKSAENSILTKKIKELECSLCETNEHNKGKFAENTVLNKKIKELEDCLCETNEQNKNHKEEINSLKNKLEKSEGREHRSQQNSKNKEDSERIKMLEFCLNDLKGKLKMCKLCKRSLRVGFSDNTEAQTDVCEPNDEQLDKLIERDELIKCQAEALRMLQQQLQSYREREKEWLVDKEKSKKSCNDVQCLENQIVSLKDRLQQREKKVDELDVAVKNKEDIIKTQKEALNYVEKELDNMRSKDTELRNENQKQCVCINQLKKRIKELETTALDAERRASNLQIAVDLYTNTIKVLEGTEDKYKLEIENQRTTINNLQEALVTTKNELDSAKQNYNDSVNYQQKLSVKFLQIISENEAEKDQLTQQLYLISDRYENLQELNFNVELEHCNSLQDVEDLDYQLFNYHTLLKNSEDELKQCKNYLKKLMKQKKNFEEVIQYFKQEMSKMAEQLENLQDLLTASHDSAQEESNKLMSAYANIQDLNQKLSKQLATAEQKVLLESQMNQLNEAKINELERLVSDKEIDLSRQCQTFKNIKETLSCSLCQNKELQKTISSLSETLGEFQQAVKHYEHDNRQVKEVSAICQNQIESCKEKLTDLKNLVQEKTSELCKIERAYNNQHRSLKCCQRELKDLKDRQKNKQYYLKCVIEELKDKLMKTEADRDKHLRDITKLQGKLMANKKEDSTKDEEIARYRKIICDLKKTLTELNKSLTKKDIPFKSKCNREGCKKYMEQFNCETDSFDANNLNCTDCPCETDFYRTLVDHLKKAVTDLKTRLFDSQNKNKEIETELRQKELQVEEISRTQLEKDKEYNELKQKLMDRLKKTQVEEARFSDRSKQFENELEFLRRELELKTLQLNEVERNSKQLSGSKCAQLTYAQEEINVLKENLNKLLKQHCAINIDNQKLQSQSAKMQSTVINLEEKSQLLKTQVEQYLAELQMVQKEKEILHNKNQDLLHELRTLQSSYDGQQRYNENTIKSLETELNEVKKHRDDIYFESKTVVEYFRLWLKEQKKINEYTMAKEKDYCKTIDMLKQQNDGPPCDYQPRPFSRNIDTLRMTQESCQSPWSLGSQGTSSGHDESPCRSPCNIETCDWYSPNFKNDSEEEMEDDEDWVTKVENLAAQVRRTNKMWKHKMEKADLTVSKDCQK